MKDVNHAQELIGSEVYDNDGDKVGSVGHVYLDDDTSQPEWVTVRTGMFGTKESFVPLSGASATDRGVNVNVSQEKVKNAPRVEAEHGHLSEQEGQNLYDYYELRSGASQQDTRQSTGEDTRQSTGQEQSEAGGQRSRSTSETASEESSSEPQTMTRSEEHLRVGTENVESGRVRLRKYVTTEQESVTVPVSHEEVHLEREPISESERQRGASGTEIGESEEEIVVHSERPVVEKESVPVERMRMETENVTEEQTISEEVRREQFDVDDETGRHRREQGT